MREHYRLHNYHECSQDVTWAKNIDIANISISPIFWEQKYRFQKGDIDTAPVGTVLIWPTMHIWMTYEIKLWIMKLTATERTCALDWSMRQECSICLMESKYWFCWLPKIPGTMLQNKQKMPFNVVQCTPIWELGCTHCYSETFSRAWKQLWPDALPSTTND